MPRDFFDEVGGFDPNRYRRTTTKRDYMGLGARKKTNDMRDRQGKVVNPKAVKSGSGTPGQTSSQYKQTGPKYTGPNYPQADKTIVPFGGK